MGIAPYGIEVEIGRDLADTNPPGVDGIPYGGCNEHKVFIFKYNLNFFADSLVFWSIYLNISNCKQYITFLFFERFAKRYIFTSFKSVIYIFFENSMWWRIVFGIKRRRNVKKRK